MKVLIVEDEPGVAQNLCDVLQEINAEIEILSIVESVEETVLWIENNPSPDLGFFDIRLADGNSFEIFEQTEVNFPVIFTTAYDEFALKAFKVNSIDYLLKPIDRKEIENAINKYLKIYKKHTGFDFEKLMNVIDGFREAKQTKFKKNLLVYQGEKIIPLDINSIGYFQLQNEIVFAVTHANVKYVMDESLEKIMNKLDPGLFFRANRQIIVSRLAVKGASQHFNRKLILNLFPKPNRQVFVSKSRVTAFKSWLSG